MKKLTKVKTLLIILPFIYSFYLFSDNKSDARDWQSINHQNHPLINVIWDVTGKSVINKSDLKNLIIKANYLLIGETHDNPDHHSLQAEIINIKVSTNKRPAVIFEMITENQQDALNKQLNANPNDVKAIGPALNWGESGWPEWKLYMPIAQAAINGQLKMYAGGFNRKTARAIAYGNYTKLSDSFTKIINLNDEIPTGISIEIARDIDEGHCGYAPENLINGMVRTQWSRDSYMASRLIKFSNDLNGAILIAGTGHVRLDRGVPLHLKANKQRSNTLSIGLIEVHPEFNHPDDYASFFNSKYLPFHIVWFTPRVDTQNNCERFKESLQKMKKE